MTTPADRRRSERGAVLIHVCIALLAMTAFSAIVVDYGIMWAARGQSQNAADMGGHAGAVAFAFDASTTDADINQKRIKDIATAIAARNPVIGQAPSDATVNLNLLDCAGAGVADCVQFEVYRNKDKSNKLPMFFGTLFGGGWTGGGAKARTVVRNASGGGSDCLAPFVFPDKWREVMNEKGETKEEKDWNGGKGFDNYCNKAVGCQEIKDTSPKQYVYAWADPFPNNLWDTYTAPGAGGAGTGYKFTTDGGTSDYGQKLDADDKTPVPTDLTIPYDKGNPYGKSYLGVNIGRNWEDPPDPAVDSAAAAANYIENIKSCNGTPIFVGEELPYYAPTATDTQTGTQFVYNSDPNATWNKDLGKIENSCAADGTCNLDPVAARQSRHGMSPRVMDLALFDPKVFEDDRLCKNFDGTPRSGCTPQITLKITNIIGIFLNPKDSGELKDGKFKSIIVPTKALTCTAEMKGKKKLKAKKGTFDCPDPNPESFTRALSFYR